jgi:hypothetical protein
MAKALRVEFSGTLYPGNRRGVGLSYTSVRIGLSNMEWRQKARPDSSV